jgi:hypothetical protein
MTPTAHFSVLNQSSFGLPLSLNQSLLSRELIRKQPNHLRFSQILRSPALAPTLAASFAAEEQMRPRER